MKKVFLTNIILMIIIVSAQTVLGDATGKWTYYSFGQWQNDQCDIGGLPNIRGGGTITITQTGNDVELVNNTYGRTYTGSVSNGSYSVSGSYLFKSGTKIAPPPMPNRIDVIPPRSPTIGMKG